MRRTLFQFALGIAAFVLLCESVFRVLPVSTATRVGYYIDGNIPSYPPSSEWQYSSGWDLRNAQSMHTNNVGFISQHDFVRDSNAVVLIGDSYVEAAGLASIDRPEPQLERALPSHRPVYAMGMGGTSLLDYAARILFAARHFDSRDFVVVMERGDVRQALCGSGNANSQCLDPKTLEPVTVTLDAPSALKRVLRNSALAQYLQSQLKIDPAQMLRLAFRRQPAAADSRQSVPPTHVAALPSMHEVDAVTEAFFERVKPSIRGRLVIAIDSDRDALMQHRPVDDPERRRFIALARAAGAIVVDTEPLFREHFAHSPLSLDLAPSDGHYNALAVQLVTTAAAHALEQAAQ